MKPRWMSFALAACFALVAPVAHGQAHGDAKKEAKEKKHDAKPAPEDAGDAAAGTTADASRDLPKPSDTKKDKAERRRRAIAATRARWGALTVNPAAQAELRLHARRVAKLDVMEEVARASGKDALLPRIAVLREKENARFEKRMDWIKDEKEGGT